MSADHIGPDTCGCWPRRVTRAYDASSACPGSLWFDDPEGGLDLHHLRVVEAGLAQLGEVGGDHVLPGLVSALRGLHVPVSEIRLGRFLRPAEEYEGVRAIGYCDSKVRPVRKRALRGIERLRELPSE